MKDLRAAKALHDLYSDAVRLQEIKRGFREQGPDELFLPEDFKKQAEYFQTAYGTALVHAKGKIDTLLNIDPKIIIESLIEGALLYNPNVLRPLFGRVYPRYSIESSVDF